MLVPRVGLEPTHPEGYWILNPAAEEGIVKLDKELVKKKKWLARRRELYSWHRRAAVVGIATLPPKKVSKGTRLEWEESIIQAEGGRGV